MSSAQARPRWHFVFRPKWLAWHAFTFVAVAGMLWLGDWQFHRAVSGNGLSWAYTFEWPVFAVFGAVFWAKTIFDEMRPSGSGGLEADEIELPGGAGLPASGGSGQGVLAIRDEDDPELAAYNAYLSRLHEQVRGHGKWHGLR
jgi:hypothetical protein